MKLLYCFSVQIHNLIVIICSFSQCQASVSRNFVRITNMIYWWYHFYQILMIWSWEKFAYSLLIRTTMDFPPRRLLSALLDCIVHNNKVFGITTPYEKVERKKYAAVNKHLSISFIKPALAGGKFEKAGNSWRLAVIEKELMRV